MSLRIKPRPTTAPALAARVIGLSLSYAVWWAWSHIFIPMLSLVLPWPAVGWLWKRLSHDMHRTDWWLVFELELDTLGYVYPHQRSPIDFEEISAVHVTGPGHPPGGSMVKLDKGFAATAEVWQTESMQGAGVLSAPANLRCPKIDTETKLSTPCECGCKEDQDIW